MAIGSTVIQLVLRARDEASNVLSGATAKITGLIAAFAGAAAIHKTVEDLTALDLASQRLSISTEDLSAAQYAAFKGAGVGAENLVDALEEVRIKMEEWSSIQSGGATDFFEVMNVSVKEFQKLNPLDQLYKMSDVMKNMSASAKFTFLDQIGSDNLRNLLPLLQNGSSEFKRLAAEAKAFNIVVSGLDAKSVSQLSRDFQSLGSVMQGTFNKAFAGIAPELDGLVNLFRDMLTDMSTSAQGPLSNLNEKFKDFVDSVVETFSFLSQLKDSLDIAFHGAAAGMLWLTRQFLTSGAAIQNVFADIGNFIVSVFSKAFSGVLAIINNQFLEPMSKIGVFPGMEELGNKFQSLSSKFTDYSTKLNSAPPAFKTEPVDLLIAKLKELEEAEKQAVRDNVKVMIQTDIDTKGFKAKVRTAMDDSRKDLESKVNGQAQQTAQDLAKGGDAKFNLANATAAAAIATAQAQARAELSKLDIQQKINDVSALQEIETAGLEERARQEKLTSNQIAEEKYRIASEAAKKTADLQKKLLDEDIKALQVQIAGQKSVLATAVNDTDRGTARTALATIEAQITNLKRQQVAIDAQNINQQAVLQAQRASERNSLKAELEQIRKDAEIQLKIVRGDTYSADLDAIERDFKGTVEKLEELGEDSVAVKNLIDAKKALAEMSEIEKQYGLLKDKLEKHQISPLDYVDKVNELDSMGQAAAETTGNPEDISRMADAAKAARAEVFDLETMVDGIGDSFSSGLEGLFSDFISGTKSAKEAFADFAQGVLSDIAKMVAKLLIQLAIQSALSMYTGGTSTGAASLMGSISAGVNHSGGKAGRSGRSRAINPMAFINPEYHHLGGIAGAGSYMPGLKSNEVPSILEKGEEVLTKNDPRHVNNIGKGNNGNSSGSQTPITIINTLDSESAAKQMLETSAGQRAVMNIWRANKSELQNM